MQRVLTPSQNKLPRIDARSCVEDAVFVLRLLLTDTVSHQVWDGTSNLPSGEIYKTKRQHTDLCHSHTQK